VGERLARRLDAWQAEYPLVGDARGLGAMRAVELVVDRASQRPATKAASRVLAAAQERGLLVLRAGLHDSVIRILAPLVIDDATLDRGLDILEQAIAHAYVAGEN
jgi:4-aminobutyrate aminotransferase/(S)-3-amino-2-methylpropionate transaminase